MTDRALLSAKINQNTHQLDILSAEDLVSAWEQETGKNFSELIVESGKTASSHVAPAMDAVTATKLVADLGFNGRAVTKTVRGKDYVIFKGLPGTRSLFTGTRYLASNTKVVDMAIGRAGVANSVLSGARLTIYLQVPLEVLRFIISDHHSMSRLIGTIAVDIVKVGVASALAGMAGTAAAAITTLAAGPLIVAIAVGVLVGLTLDHLDKKFGVTEKLIDTLEKSYDNSFGSLGRAINEIEYTLKWQATHGVSLGKGIFY